MSDDKAAAAAPGETDLAQQFIELERELQAVKKETGKLKKLLSFTGVMAMLLGGGGAFGAVKWFVGRPMEEQIAQVGLEKAQQEKDLIALKASVGTFETSIESLRRSIDQAKSSGSDPAQIAALERELSDTERKLRDTVTEVGERLTRSLGVLRECMRYLSLDEGLSASTRDLMRRSIDKL